jgi:hypothetical protein
MSKRRAASLSFFLAASPLIGCAGGLPEVSQQAPPLPVPTAAEYPAPSRFYQAERAAPAAILVVLPGAGAFGSDPALWTSQGFDIVTPPPAAFYRLAAEEDAALAQMLAAAWRLADAPIWLIGPNPEIQAALAAPRSGAEAVSGVVETSSGGATSVCSASFSYFDPGTGAKPQVKFSRSGDCPPGSGFGIGVPSAAPAAPVAPAVRPKAPRVIEASASPDFSSPAAHRAAVERLAALIKAAPSS